jgi:hypothetical protein
MARGGAQGERPMAHEGECRKEETAHGVFIVRSPPMRRAFLVPLVIAVTGCASQTLPDPRDAAHAYAAAASRGDADAIYGMMTEASQKARSKDDIKKIVSDERAELAEQAAAIGGKDVRVEATARLRFEDGEEAALELRDGRYWVSASGALPGGARTPEEALDQLRRVVARRSYAGLMRVLSPATRAMIEADLRALVTGLDRPETLQVQVNGDSATVIVPGGHHVRLKRDGGLWRVDNFD